MLVSVTSEGQRILCGRRAFYIQYVVEDCISMALREDGGEGIHSSRVSDADLFSST